MVNSKLLSFGIVITVGALGTVSHARAQTDQDMANINELSHYNQILSAFADACATAMQNHNAASTAKCTQLINEEHDILKPFMDNNKDAMSQVILGP